MDIKNNLSFKILSICFFLFLLVGCTARENKFKVSEVDLQQDLELYQEWYSDIMDTPVSWIKCNRGLTGIYNPISKTMIWQEGYNCDNHVYEFLEVSHGFYLKYFQYTNVYTETYCRETKLPVNGTINCRTEFIEEDGYIVGSLNIKCGDSISGFCYIDNFEEFSSLKDESASY